MKWSAPQTADIATHMMTAHQRLAPSVLLVNHFPPHIPADTPCMGGHVPLRTGKREIVTCEI